jgi:hypothetical protein
VAGGIWDAHPEAMGDRELVEHARAVYRLLNATPRWHRDNQRLITAWGRACAEAGSRGLPDYLTCGPPEPPGALGAAAVPR